MLDCRVLLLAKCTAASGWRQALTVLARLCPLCPEHCPRHLSLQPLGAGHPQPLPALQEGGQQESSCQAAHPPPGRGAGAAVAGAAVRAGGKPLHKRTAAPCCCLVTLGSLGRCLLQHAAHCILHVVIFEQDAWPPARLRYPAAHLDHPLPIQPACVCDCSFNTLLHIAYIPCSA